MNEQPPATRSRLRHIRNFKWWVLALLLVYGGYGAWKEYDYRAAIREATEAGFHWESTNPLSLIQQDWQAALRKETWATHERLLIIDDVPDLGRYLDLIHRLSPLALSVNTCKNVDALNAPTSLRDLNFYNCPALQNLDMLKGFGGLQILSLVNCPTLQNIDALRGFTGLQKLTLYNCPALQNLDVLKNLPSLKDIEIFGCTALLNVNVLKGLPGLKAVHYLESPDITEDTLSELRAAMPKTNFHGVRGIQ